MHMEAIGWDIRRSTRRLDPETPRQESRPESGLESGPESEVAARVLAALATQALSRSKITTAAGRRRVSGAVSNAVDACPQSRLDTPAERG